jgi:release factor glutamine methyltransferase
MARIQESIRRTGLKQSEAVLLLAHLLGVPRTWVIAHGDNVLPLAQEETFLGFARRRAEGEPVAYLLGRKEFFGRDFLVDPSVLIPRPATEGLVEHSIDLLKGKAADAIRQIDSGIVSWAELRGEPSAAQQIVDIGTGSGCIGITMALELPHLSVLCTDLRDDALNTARSNALLHGVAERILFKSGSILDPAMDLTVPFLLVSNPPYIPIGTKLPRDVSDFEPHEALFAGPDGTDVLKPLIDQARAHPHCIGFVVECKEEQVNC